MADHDETGLAKARRELLSAVEAAHADGYLNDAERDEAVVNVEVAVMDLELGMTDG